MKPKIILEPTKKVLTSLESKNVHIELTKDTSKTTSTIIEERKIYVNLLKDTNKSTSMLIEKKEIQVKLSKDMDRLQLIIDKAGVRGAQGKSAYDIWLEEGNEGSKQDFLDSMPGTTNYEKLKNKPSIEMVELEGNKSFKELGLSEINNTEISNLL